MITAAAQAAPAQSGRTIGFVLTDIGYALYQTDDAKEECPDGLQVGDHEQFKAMPDYKAHMARFGGTSSNRGPNGELGTYVPLAIDEVLPWRELKTTVGYGLNLDGTQDGRVTVKSLAHQKFTSPSGEKVDNQMARVVGCILGWRKSGFMSESYTKQVETSLLNRILIEVTGVDDEQNDAQVQVTFYKGLDRLVRTGAGISFLPYMSQRVDERFPQFITTARGRIDDGVLTIEPIDYLRMPMSQIGPPSERRMRDFSLRLKLMGDTAEGVMAGYEDLDAWWSVYSKLPGPDPGRYSPTLVYRAAHRFADGYPDPKTGKSTAISTAYQISAVRAMIVHPSRAVGALAAAGN